MRLREAVGEGEGVGTGRARLLSSGRKGHTCGLCRPVTSVLTAGENTASWDTLAYGPTSARATEGEFPDTRRRESFPKEAPPGTQGSQSIHDGPRPMSELHSIAEPAPFFLVGGIIQEFPFLSTCTYFRGFRNQQANTALEKISVIK